MLILLPGPLLAAGCGFDLEARTRDDTDLRTLSDGSFGTTLIVEVERLPAEETDDLTGYVVQELEGRALWDSVVPGGPATGPHDHLVLTKRGEWADWLWNFWDPRSGFFARYEFEVLLEGEGGPIVEGRVTGKHWDRQTAWVDMSDIVRRRVRRRARRNAAERVVAEVIEAYDRTIQELANEVRRVSLEDPPRIAILTIDVSDLDPEDGPVFRRFLTGDLSGAGLALIERRALDELLAEQELGLTGAVDPSQAAEIGRLAGAELALFGSLSEEGGRRVAQMTFVDVETGRTLGGARAALSDDALDRLAVTLANRIVRETERIAARGDDGDGREEPDDDTTEDTSTDD